MRIGKTLSLSSALLVMAGAAFAAESSGGFVAKGPFPSHSLTKDPATNAKRLLSRLAPRSANLELAPLSTSKPDKARALGTIKLGQFHRGIPVVNRGAGMVYRSDGKPALVMAHLEEALPASIEPQIDSARAARIANRLTGLVAKETDAKLVVFPLPSGPRLSWVVVPSGRMMGVPYAPVLVLDATSGERLAGWNAVHTAARAHVYPANPVSTPNLVEVTLPLLEGSIALRNSRVTSANCIDRKGTKDFQGFPIRVCNVEQTAKADENGDFLDAPAKDNEPEDRFSEISLFHHTNRAYEYFVGLGMPELPLITTVSNLRFADGFFSDDPTGISDPNKPLVPYQNAFYVGGSTIFSQLFDVDGPAMWFGQGPVHDYSYDGDVVYHELGHALVDHTIRFPMWFHADEQGLVPSAGAMNEGIADYYSAVIAGDPVMGEYAIGDLGFDLNGIRDLSSAATCPNDLSGEVHADSVFFSAALWSIRSSLPEADRPLFDQAVFNVLATAPNGDIGYEDFADLLIASVGASALDDTAAEKVRQEMTRRGILPKCKRELVWGGSPIDGTDTFSQNAFWAPGVNDAAVGPLAYAPGVLQFQVPLEPTGHLVVKFEKLDTGPAVAAPFRPKVLVRWGKEPISFDWSSGLRDNADATVTPQTMASGLSFRAHVKVPDEVTHAYVMIVNTGEQQGAYRHVDFEFEATDDDTLPPDVAASDRFAPPAEEGCGCHVPGGTSGTSAWIAGLAAVAVIASRRASRRLS